MFCPNCGTKNDDDALFCGSCGTKLQDKAVVPPVDNDFKPDIELVQAEVQNGAQAYAQPEEQTQTQTYAQPAEQAQPQAYAQPEEQEQVQPQAYAQPEDQVQPQAYAQPEEQVQPQAYVQPEEQVQPQQSVQAGEQTQSQPYTQQNIYGQPQMPNQQNMPEYQAPGQQYYAPVQKQKPPKKPFKVNKLAVVTGILSVAFIASIVVFFVVGKNTFSAQNVATDYFKAIINGDWDVAYDMMDMDESDFINKDMFVKAVNGSDTLKVNKYTVKASESSIAADAVIKYRKRGASSDDELELFMNKEDSKQFLLFDSWKISSDSYTVSDFTVQVPSGTTLYMDDVEVPEKYIDEDTDSYTTYTIDKLFKGTHTFYIETGDFESSKGTYDVEYDEDYYTVDSIKIDQDSQKEIVDTAYGYMKQIIDAASTGQKFNSIKDIFTDDAAKDAKGEYENYFAGSFYAYAKDDGITGVALSNVDADVESVYIEEGEVFISISIRYNDANTGLTTDWWTGSLKNGSASTSGSTDMLLKYVDGKWLIANGYSIPTTISYNNWF